jgi:membrane fusion protein (multidrug efflux system)
VYSIQACTGARFSLLPPENATGNYVKVVQRVPVKLLFDEPLPADHVIGPGLSVVPSVHVTRIEIPDWAVAVLAVVLAGAGQSIFRFAMQRKLNRTAAR